MTQNMKFTSFLFLLFFMQLTAIPNNYNLTPNSGFKVWSIDVNGKAEEILFNKKATYKLKQDIGYLLINIQEGRCDIVYFLGAQLLLDIKVIMAEAVTEAVNEAFRNLPELDIYIKKIRSASPNTNYQALLNYDENKKIPRLYRVDRPDIVYQVKMNCTGFMHNNVFVLYDGSTVTIYHSKSKNSENDTVTENDFSKIKTAFFLARYIVQVEKLKENSIRFLNETEKSSADARRLMVDKIINLAKENDRRPANLSSNKKEYIKKTAKLLGIENEEPEGVKFSYFGSPECMLIDTITSLYDTFKSECIYLMRDYDENEFVVVFGRKSGQSEQKSALVFVEQDYYVTKCQVKFIVEGDLLPTTFMINFKSEVEKSLRDSSEE